VFRRYGVAKQLLSPVQQMLDQISTIADQQLHTATSMVDSVSGSIRNISEKVGVAINQIDQLQERYLPTNVTNKKELNLVNAMQWAYYVSAAAFTRE
jgi:hypothetical protein